MNQLASFRRSFRLWLDREIEKIQKFAVDDLASAIRWSATYPEQSVPFLNRRTSNLRQREIPFSPRRLDEHIILFSSLVLEL